MPEKFQNQLSHHKAFNNRLRRACVSLLRSFFVLSSTLHLVAAADDPQFQRARTLATNVCGVCHLFPEPAALDRHTWSNNVVPLMRSKMGIAALENDPSPDARTLMRQWNSIWNEYYLPTAPEKPPP